jgi:hypothetical protein
VPADGVDTAATVRIRDQSTHVLEVDAVAVFGRTLLDAKDIPAVDRDVRAAQSFDV